MPVAILPIRYCPSDVDALDLVGGRSPPEACCAALVGAACFAENPGGPRVSSTEGLRPGTVIGSYE